MSTPNAVNVEARARELLARELLERCIAAARHRADLRAMLLIAASGDPFTAEAVRSAGLFGYLPAYWGRLRVRKRLRARRVS